MNELSNPKYWKEFYGHVQNQVYRVLNVLNDLGSVTELSSASIREKLHFNEVIKTTLHKLSLELKTKDIKITKNIPEDLALLMVDNAKFHQLFELLLKDEILYLSKGDEITISAYNHLTEDEEGGKVVIEVCDNGPGLPEDEISSVFDPFYQRNGEPQEFGINLMACYFIVYHHDGKIEVNNRGDKGTKFTLTFHTQTPSNKNEMAEREFLGNVLMNEKNFEKMLAEY